MSETAEALKNTEAALWEQFEQLKNQLTSQCGVSVTPSPSRDLEQEEEPQELKEVKEEETKLVQQQEEAIEETTEEQVKKENEVTTEIPADVVAVEHHATTTTTTTKEEDKEPPQETEQDTLIATTTTETSEKEEPREEEEWKAPAKTVEELEEERRERENEEMFAKVVVPFVNDSFIIDDYDHHDTLKPLMQVVRTRIEGTREYSPPLFGGDEQDAVALRASTSSAASAEQGALPSLLPREMQALRAPKGWKPVIEGLNIFELPKSTPEDQGSCCFGCGVPFTAKPRLCEYTARYFCARCFPPTAKKFYVPARVVARWDHEQYPVNPRSYNYLAAVMADPTIDVSLAHEALYSRVPTMKDLRMVRQKLYHMKDFILTCTKLRENDPAKHMLARCRAYHYTHVDVYSLDDLVHAQKLLDTLMDALETWLTHIAACELCGAKGSYCEICGKNERIFPFQLLEAAQCPKCKGVFHRACLKKTKCPKCQRLAKRRSQLL